MKIELSIRKLFSVNYEDPYRFFVSIYHIAHLFEKKILSIDSREPGVDGDIFSIPLENELGAFNVGDIRTTVQNNKYDEKSAVRLIKTLLWKLDHYLAGMGDDTSYSSDYIDRLSNPNYYEDIDIRLISKSTHTYLIAPNIPSMFAEKINMLMPRGREYYNDTISYQFLQFHTIIESRSVDNASVLMSHGTEGAFLNRSFHMSFIGMQRLTIGLAHFDKGVVSAASPLRKHKRKGKNVCTFIYDKITGPSKKEIRKRIEGIFENSRKHFVDILIFPELTVDDYVFSCIQNCLREKNEDGFIKLVVCGSYHRKLKSGEHVNQARMLDMNGDLLWVHNKCSIFELERKTINESTNKLQILKAFKIKENTTLQEDINIENPFSFVDTPIGRMCTLICLDYIHSTIKTVLRRIPCDYFWVPAMTTTTRPFHDNMKIFRENYHITSAICASVSCIELIFGNYNAKRKSFLKVPFGDIEEGRQEYEDEYLQVIGIDKN